MEQPRKFIEAKHERGNFKIVSDILDTLTLPENGILWQKNAAEYIFFSQEKWKLFFNEMKKKSGMMGIQLQYSKNGRNFIRELSSKGTAITTKEQMLHIERGAVMKKRIPEGKCRVEICV